MVIKRLIFYLLFLVLVLLIQTALPPSLPIIGPRPDLLLITILVTGLLKGTKCGVGTGFWAGLLQDLFLGGMFGIYTIVKSVTGGLAGLLEGKIYKENFILPPVIIFIATLIHEVLVILLSEELLFKIDFIYFFRRVILPEAVVNGLLGVVIYLLFFRIDNHGGSRYG